VSPLIAEGDPAPLPHVLPPIPTETVERFVGKTSTEDWAQVNAVAQCERCGSLFVSREDPDGWGRVVRWVPLRWWHRTAIAKVRVLQAAAEGGVAP